MVGRSLRTIALSAVAFLSIASSACGGADDRVGGPPPDGIDVVAPTPAPAPTDGGPAPAPGAVSVLVTTSYEGTRRGPVQVVVRDRAGAIVANLDLGEGSVFPRRTIIDEKTLGPGRYTFQAILSSEVALESVPAEHEVVVGVPLCVPLTLPTR